MEGKAMIFKEFGGIDAFPIVLATKDVDEIVNTVKYISPAFGGINLEDISAPRCFEIETRLRKMLDIPVFHDDQHGTAVVALASLINVSRLLKRDLKKMKVVVVGAGAAGTAITKILLASGVKDIIACDRATRPGRFFSSKAYPPAVMMASIRMTRKVLFSISPAIRPIPITPAVNALQVNPMPIIPPMKAEAASKISRCSVGV
jgi:hypothetical protein